MGIINFTSEMKNFVLPAVISALAAANSNVDDDLGIFGDTDQWRTGIVDIDKRSDIFYWMLISTGNQRHRPTYHVAFWWSGLLFRVSTFC